jgi:hypothetical protein
MYWVRYISDTSPSDYLKSQMILGKRASILSSIWLFDLVSLDVIISYQILKKFDELGKTLI